MKTKVGQRVSFRVFGAEKKGTVTYIGDLTVTVKLEDGTSIHVNRYEVKPESEDSTTRKRKMASKKKAAVAKKSVAAPKAKPAAKKKAAATESTRKFLTAEQKVTLVKFFMEAKKKDTKFKEALEALVKKNPEFAAYPESNLLQYYYAAGKRLVVKDGVVVNA